MGTETTLHFYTIEVPVAIILDGVAGVGPEAAFDEACKIIVEMCEAKGVDVESRFPRAYPGEESNVS